MQLLQVLGRAACALAAAATLASCGGGSSAVDEFRASAVFAFGDELSVLTDDGRKYGVNVLDDAGNIDCEAQPIWVQQLASFFDLVFPQCNPDGVDALAVMRAAPGARAADLTAQIDAQLAGDGFGAEPLASVLIGTHDVLDLYAEYPQRSADDLAAEARERGDGVGDQVTRLSDLGVKVIVSTIPDAGLSPFGQAEQAAHDDIDRAALLTRLTAAFNAGLRTTMPNDGRRVGLVLADEMVQAMVKFPASFALTEVEQGLCAAPLPSCTSDTLIDPDASATNYLWADPIWLAFGGQNRLALLAVTRARENPF